MNAFLNIQSFDISGLISNIKNVFLGFTVKSAIEIFIITICLFLVVSFLKGRKGGALIVGALICIAMLGISKLLQFNALYMIFNTIISSGAIVILIIFQPEIRDGLERIGNGSINGILNFSDRRKKKQLYNTIIDNICSAVGELSKEQTGALIVIERTTSLSEVIASGIKINSDVNSMLLRNLFYNKAPLHDGAVVISDGRIAAAGCFLPLTQKPGFDPNLGTRHRAAMGTAEVSDAIVVIVSEETGQISVAYDCSFTRGYDEKSLKEFLTANVLNFR